MRASDWEYRHQALIHLLVVGLAALTYAYDSVDIVWAVVRYHAEPAWWERLVFGWGALMALGSAALATYARAPLLVRVLSTLTVGLLLPPAGTILLLAGENILIARLVMRDAENEEKLVWTWGSGLRSSAAKWGMAATMIVFVWTLNDRIAEAGAVASVMVWLVLHVPGRARSHSR